MFQNFMNLLKFQEGFHETFATDPTCLRNCSIDGAVPACLTSLLNDYQNKGGICKDSLMDSEVTYSASGCRATCTTPSTNCAFACGAGQTCCLVRSTEVDYSDTWKVSSETCTLDATNTLIGNSDPYEEAPTITAGLCSAETEVIIRYNSISSSSRTN